MNLNYTTGIPNAPNNPSNDQPIMQTNANSISTWVEQDHIGFNTNNGGYHLAAHCEDYGGDPATLGGFGTYYAKTIGSDIQAFFKSGLGVVTQLTGPTAPSVTNSGFGYVFLPGGLLLQWGYVNSTSSSFHTVNFATNNNNFPNECLGVFTQVYGSGTPATSQGNIDIRASTVSNSSFQWAFVSNSAQYTGFYWLAIGF